ncbi:MAG TPA: ATP-binding protein [Polyangiaceae bacterium]|nr:ATP-binding protein [Polyangiaceae bacterium]
MPPAVTDTDTSRGGSPSAVLSRRLATGFAAISLVALAMCVVLEMLLGTVETSVGEMQRGEQAIRDGLALATAVREQYIHQAHVLVERSDAHMAHYSRWVERIQLDATALRARLPRSEHWRIDALLEDSTALDQLFRAQLLPALQRPDFAQVVRARHSEAERLSADAIAHADALARSAEAGMSGEHLRAIHASRLGLMTGATCMLLVVALSVMYTFRLRRSLLAPLATLVAAAGRFGEGAFDTRVGRIGEGELQAVADACDHMAVELQLRERRLLETERMAVIGQFAAGIAHELNNPIGVMRGYLKTMSPTQPPEMLREELQILDEEAAACQRIAEDLLSFARPQEIERAPLAVDELLSSIVQRFIASGESNGHPVELRAEAQELWADAGRLRQVVLNLLRNAVQASPPGEAIELTGVRGRGGDEYVLCVADHGAGVRAEDKRRIFEPFFSKHDGGSGLGLAVCHGIVAAHGGSIAVEDRAPQGAVLKVALPIRTRVSEVRS